MNGSGARIEIRYCAQCRWMLRAAWMAQELLSTFPDEIKELALIPATGGVFEIDAEGKRVWSRADDGGFPEIAELKRRMRDAIAPSKTLGHSERRTSNSESR